MKKYFVPYYPQFECLAEKCTVNCCNFKIFLFDREVRALDEIPEWQDVDGQGHRMRDFVESTPEGWRCRRKENGDCILLDDGLCKVQRIYGQKALPSVCRTFPRIITNVSGRLEFALDTCCPHVLELAKDWNLCEFSVEGDGPLASDEAFVRRGKALAMIADPSMDFYLCLQSLSDLYGCDADIPSFSISAEQEIFAKKALALTIWAFLIPYDGYEGVGNMMGFLISVMLEMISCLEETEEENWTAMSHSFTEILKSAQARIGFEGEFEDRYIDSSEQAV